ncbi:beta-N-acetylhexosaminidase [Plantactinospora sp. KLBMP9567]|uniref:beta-N-acetylhexosaminidase n=1 Tax=Plantactinospora sp. KLBMP9567 TaxID=3085900 RepID=UPI002981D979|nr:beta-N-acetylhexosaminidase [Plantactinospora sp. KLBMP9567]MDW5326575.1 beta-N-acetylhexosaminidase [Plantactinospora sp. KLBMP9567]
MPLPRPAHTVEGSGSFELGPATTLGAESSCAGVARLLRETLSRSTGLPLPAPSPGDGARSGGGAVAGGGSIALAVDPALAAEGYHLRVRPDGVTITGGAPAGVFYGTQTLLQLLPPGVHRRARVSADPWRVPAVEISDAPRFGWRGCMLDVARHFMPVAGVLRLVDLLAAHKLNVLHLHLTDDQGWRVQIRRYPRLTEVGAWRPESMVGSRQHERFDGRPHGGYYRQDDLREIVGYAAERFVTVVPEIDLPGHTQAAIAAYPELGNDPGELVAVSTRWGISRRVLNVSDQTLDFVRHVLDEVMELFPGRHIGIGGDECDKSEWRVSPAAQRRRTELGLRDEDELQSWFVRQLQRHLAANGRVLFGWDEVLEGGLPGEATVAAWRGPALAVAAARAGHDVVSCWDTSAYLDYRQSDRPDEPVPVGTVLTVADVRAFEPVPAELPAQLRHRIVGAQCNLWTEHADNPRAVDYLAFPRLSAFAEAVWSAPDTMDGFDDRLREHLDRLDALGVEYRPPGGPLPWQRRPDAAGWPRQRADRDAELAGLAGNVLRQRTAAEAGSDPAQSPLDSGHPAAPSSS